MTSKTWTRKQFLELGAGVVGFGAVLGTFGCPGDDTSDDGSDPSTGGTPATGSDGSSGDPPGTTSGPDATTGGPGETTAGAGCGTGADAEIGTNHGHSMFVPIADIEAGVDVTYDITGTSGHLHEVTLTADQLAMIAAGMTVMVTSTEGGAHTHEVTVSC